MKKKILASTGSDWCWWTEKLVGNENDGGKVVAIGVETSRVKSSQVMQLLGLDGT